MPKPPELNFFSPPRRPGNEPARQKALEDSGALDRDNAPFDALARRAAELLGTPMAAVSLIDGSRQYFLGEAGIEARETARAVSFCGHAILGETSFVVTDAADDARFAGNPLVTGDPSIRFYAGVPLLGKGGQALGALCVIDRSPRAELTAAQEAELAGLAQEAMRLIDQRGED